MARESYTINVGTSAIEMFVDATSQRVHAARVRRNWRVRIVGEPSQERRDETGAILRKDDRPVVPAPRASWETLGPSIAAAVKPTPPFITWWRNNVD